jgi:hypothetical protein
MLELPDYGALACVSKTLQKKVQPILDAEWNRILKAITFGRDTWLNIPGVVTVSDEPLVTENQLKTITAKLKAVCQIFNEPDPVKPHRFQYGKVKKTWETHMLIFFPEFINGEYRTLNVIGHLFRFEREGDNPTVFESLPNVYDETYRKQSPSGSYWRLVPRDVFPMSRYTQSEKMMEIVKCKGRVIPHPSDAATAILTMNFEHSHAKKDYFFGHSTYMVTNKECYAGRFIVGVASSSGLTVNLCSFEAPDVGAAGFAEVL